ncbi:unnamed protein product [Leptidea sinapis]|uniref:Suppressor APC domain-containing protein n=1 Tax=Leptidea sinapis TaxID=189913 RepID=A0A5E4R770_9NEOP|nr:unnamed protein product [Leptidea sinapis]
MESLPKQFVLAMRTLFNIMDDKQTGYIKLTDIENRWRDDRTKGLPAGVIESLQKVAHDGFLTFDSFCTGLKICLLRNQVQGVSNDILISNDIGDSSYNNKIISQPLPEDTRAKQKTERNWTNIKNTRNGTQIRTSSMPHLSDNLLVHESGNSADDILHRTYGPPKPPRLEKNINEGKEKLKSESHKSDMNIDMEDISRSIVDVQGRSSGDGRSATVSQSVVCRTSRRREPRRHTLHNGIDYNLLKRMKQIEQEKDILLQGLTAVEEAREWYLKQLAEVQDKMRYAGRMGAYVEPWNEAHQERLELLRARILELNRQLGALATGWRHGHLSLHMNLALPATLYNTTSSTPRSKQEKRKNINP